MYWLCAEFYRGSGRLSRTWIEQGDESPDTPDACEGQECYCQGNANAHVPYPFNGMGGRVMGNYRTEAEVKEAEAQLQDDDGDRVR